MVGPFPAHGHALQVKNHVGVDYTGDRSNDQTDAREDLEDPSLVDERVDGDEQEGCKDERLRLWRGTRH